MSVPYELSWNLIDIFPTVHSKYAVSMVYNSKFLYLEKILEAIFVDIECSLMF